MRIEWLYEARCEYRDIISYYKMNVGEKNAEKISRKILDSVGNLADFPKSCVLRDGTLMGEYGFRAIFIEQYACIYKIMGDTVYIYHLTDARTNYIYNIFGVVSD